MEKLIAEYDKAPFQTVKETARITGISQYAIRQGIKDEAIPFLMRGKKYFINVPEYLKQLHEESMGVMG